MCPRLTDHYSLSDHYRLTDHYTSCLINDYKKIIDIRDGTLWPGKSELLKMMRSIPKNTLIDELGEWLPNKQKKYWKDIIK